MTFALGLTGSIGMGKTTTAAMFAEAGIPVWDADATVHQLYEKGGAAVGPLGEVFPEAVINGAISRIHLKQIIGPDKAILKQIETIVHPLVAAHRAAFLSDAQSDIVLFDIPLLYETKAERWLDAVLVVSAPENIQRSRVLSRLEMNEEQFALILSRQLPDAEKRARADYIIETVDMDAARQSVRNLMMKIRKEMADA